MLPPTTPVTDKVRFSPGKDYATIKPAAAIERVVIKTKTRSWEVHQIPPMEMHKKRKKEVRGIPLYFSLAAAEHKIYLFPTPHYVITAEIEYIPA